MSRLTLAATMLLAAVPAAAQPNPFKIPKANIKGAEVSYSLTGDATGTAILAYDGDRMARRQTSTMKMMGKTTTVDSWTLTTADSVYNADLTKKEGTVLPNMLPLMAKAYDNLDGDGKKRMHTNMEEMGSLFAKGFGLNNITAGEKLGIKTYAGQECEERKLGPITVCNMSKAPIMLHSQVGLACFKFEETATAVKLGGASDVAFAPPAGVAFTPDKHIQNADSAASALVNYMASQQLADSIAKAKAEMAKAQAQPGAAAPGEMPKMTPEQEAAMTKACETFKNLDIGKVIGDAASNAMKSMAAQAKQAAVDAAKNAATNKIQGIFKKPKIPLS
ncbi:MAG TPA: hypothetical protein VF187_06755 [Gemmatimonadales bacterium]